MVGHSSINRARRGGTTLIYTAAEPLHELRHLLSLSLSLCLLSVCLSLSLSLALSSRLVSRAHSSLRRNRSNRSRAAEAMLMTVMMTGEKKTQWSTYSQNWIRSSSYMMDQIRPKPPWSTEPLMMTATMPANMKQICTTSVHITAFIPPCRPHTERVKQYLRSRLDHTVPEAYTQREHRDLALTGCILSIL